MLEIFSILHIFLDLFKNRTGRGQTDGQTDRQTDTRTCRLSDQLGPEVRVGENVH